MTSSPQDCRPIAIFGPSGVGKGTLAGKLCSTHPNAFAFAVSHTTRKQRANESDGQDYFYTSEATFTAMIAQKSFIEHTFYNGNYYGTSKQAIKKQGKEDLVVVLDIDIDGVEQLKADPTINARFVCIKPPSLEALGRRLRGRGTEDEDKIQERLARARIELEYAERPDAYDKAIINDDLEQAYKELEEFAFRPLS